MFLRRIQDRDSVTKAQDFIERGDTVQTLLMRGTSGVGTPHNIERTYVPLKLGKAEYQEFITWVGGWVARYCRK